MWEMISQFRWQDGVDIGIITFLVYRLLQILRGSRAIQMILGLAVILVAYASSRALGLFTLSWIIDNFLGSIILVIIVIFRKRYPPRAYTGGHGAAVRGHRANDPKARGYYR